MTHRVTLIPGDGTGPELTEATVRVLEAVCSGLEWDVQQVGKAAFDEGDDQPLPARVPDSIARNGVAIKGPVSTQAGSGFRSVNIALRRNLDLYAQVRPCKTYPGPHRSHAAVDLVVIRETTEDLYSGIEFERGSEEAAQLLDWLASQGQPRLHPATGFSIKPISEPAARRIVAFAFDYARRHGRRKVTAVHKATVMKFTDGLFLDAAREVARTNTDIEFDEMTIDSLCLQLVRRPADYDVLVSTNLYGDILSDLAAGLVGGVGLAPGANYGERAALFEPAHGSAPKYAGLNKVNPIAMMLSGALMLRHLGEVASADRLERAIASVIGEGLRVTYDLKPQRDDPTAATTSDVAEAVIEKLGSEVRA